MRSKDRIIEVKKATNLGYIPAFLSFMHRHLEKEQSEGKCAGFGEVEYQVPVDLLGLSVSDGALVREIESVTLTYKPK
jgi:hypothetical protein